ncbi:hypothetical protein TYRP_003709 [Tyrophagus putrescentiae]|nr:hypothetical protein TYRP_003709 [Tyrophagus putrescentiae]
MKIVRRDAGAPGVLPLTSSQSSAQISLTNMEASLTSSTKSYDYGNKQAKVLLTTTSEDTDLAVVVENEFPDLLQGIGKTSVVEHRIDTGDHRPIAIRGRRIPVHYRETRQHVQELLKEDIIEEADGDWRSRW